MNKLSVTIATYNRKELLAKVLESLSSQSLSKSLYEIIICDSNSSDGTEVFVKTFALRNKELAIRIVQTENILAAKRNIGVCESRNEVVIFLDDDCVPEGRYLEKYFEIFNDAKNDVENTIFCGQVRFPSEKIKESNYYRFRDEEGFYISNEYQRVILDFKTIVVMNMAFLRKPYLARIGYVDEDFAGYGFEDQELGWRIQENGFTIIGCDALIVHHEPSGNLANYCKKFYHTGRDGGATIWRKCPAAMHKISSLRLLDPEVHAKKSSLYKCVISAIRATAFNHQLAGLVSWFLSITDRSTMFYSRAAFRFVLACAYRRGAEDRGLRKSNEHNWFQ
jgi:glycosyltransferase involved in cell wall biosynthesis